MIKIQQEYSGVGSIFFLENILNAKEKLENIFLVTGKKSYSFSLEHSLNPLLERYGVTHFYDFAVNPKLEDVQRGIKEYQENDCDVVVAIGGGSVLDIAKAINILAAQDDEPERYIRKELPLTKVGNPVVAVPTTAGTGSEATHFAVVYIGKTKYSLADPSMLPDYVILDPSLTYNLPPSITASTGMDALCQAIESYWSILSTKESKHYAKAVIPVILKHLPVAVNNPTADARAVMMTAANLAGKAISISRTTACHALSYPFTSYFNVPHGHAVALTLGEMFVHNSNVTEHDCLDGRGVGYVQKTMEELTTLFDADSPEEVNTTWQSLLDSIGLERSITKLGVESGDDINIIVKNGFNPERVKNNPRDLSENDLRKILNNLK